MRAVQDPVEAFRDCEVALLIGARPRGPGMERADLLEANAAIFRQQGQALNVAASRNVKVLVVGNPCNTNAWIAMKNAPDLDPKCFSAMLRLDQNRAMSQLAEKTAPPSPRSSTWPSGATIPRHGSRHHVRHGRRQGRSVPRR